MFGEHVDLHHAFVAYLSTKGTQGRQVDFEEIEKVMSGNVLRMLSEVWL